MLRTKPGFPFWHIPGSGILYQASLTERRFLTRRRRPTNGSASALASGCSSSSSKSAMYVLVPWKPVVLVWGLLSPMIFFGFVASSVLGRKGPLRARCDYHTALIGERRYCVSGETT